MRRSLLACCVALALVAAACSSDSSDAANPDDDPTTTTAPTGDTSDATDTTDATAPAERPVPEPVAAGFRSDIYADPTRWICRPGAEPDHCDTDLDATSVAADGTLTVERHTRAQDPPVDCFYLYPTISEDPTPTADFTPGAEIPNVQALFARFGSVCRLYAPIYRQVTVAGLFGGGLQRDPELWARAFDDVSEAWRHYVANENDGRGVILVGHSQGAGQIVRLLSDVIEPDPGQRALLVSAMPIGSSVVVPEGELVGGSFQEIPLCSASDEFGCVVAYSAFRSTSPPPDNTLFGKPRADAEGNTPPGEAACVNPVDPSSPETPSALTPFMRNDDQVLTDPTAAAQITTPWVTYPGLLSARCVRGNGAHYLEVTVESDPADPRRDDISGDLTPEWGLHSVDINLAQGDLVRLAGRQAEAWLAANDS